MAAVDFVEAGVRHAVWLSVTLNAKPMVPTTIAPPYVALIAILSMPYQSALPAGLHEACQLDETLGSLAIRLGALTRQVGGRLPVLFEWREITLPVWEIAHIAR